MYTFQHIILLLSLLIELEMCSMNRCMCLFRQQLMLLQFHHKHHCK